MGPTPWHGAGLLHRPSPLALRLVASYLGLSAASASSP